MGNYRSMTGRATELEFPNETDARGASMAERVRSHDWAATPLGPLAGWPEALRAAIETALRSGFPTALLAGPDFTLCAYNDAYAPLLGAAHPALGRPYLEIWAPGAPIIAPQMAAAARGETVAADAAHFRIDRGRGPEDAWFDYEFAPVLDAAGVVVGVRNGVFEVTAEVRHERALAAERRLRDLALEAAGAGWWSLDGATGRASGGGHTHALLGVAEDADDLAQLWRERLHPADAASAIAQEAQTLREGGVFDMRYRVIRPDGELRHIRDIGCGPETGPEASRTLTGIVFDETDRITTESEWRERETLLRLALDAAEAGWATQEFDADGAPGPVILDAQARAVLGLEDGPVDSARWLARIHPEDRAAARAAVETAAPGDVFEVRYRIASESGRPRHVGGAGCKFVRPDSGKTVVTGLIFDETERVRREAQRELMIRELNHRVKNMFAVVQSIAAETFRNEIAAEQAIGVFEERLGALAAAHDLLVRDDLDGAALSGLIGAVAQIGAQRDRVALSGPPVAVDARRAIGLTMAFHELYTNAVKYGALSNGTGRVAVSWTLAQGAPPRLSILWRETGGPPVTPPERRGFGTFMVEEALAYEFDSVALDFRPEGLVCRIAADWPGEGGV